MIPGYTAPAATTFSTDIGAIPKVVTPQLDAAQDCTSLLGFGGTVGAKCPAFKPPYGKLSAVTRKKNELMRTVDNKHSTRSEFEQKYVSYLKVVESLFNQIDEQAKLLDPEGNHRMMAWCSPHRDDAITVKQSVERHLRENWTTQELPRRRVAESPLTSRRSVGNLSFKSGS